MSSESRLGALFIVIFNLLCASKGVYVGKLVQNVPALTVAFWTFLIAALFFVATKLPQAKALLARVRANGRRVLMLNLFSAGAWLTYYVGLQFIEPAIFMAVVFAIGPLLTVGMWQKLRPNQPPHAAERTASVGILASVLFLGATVMTGKSAMSATFGHALFGLLCAVLGGMCVVGVTIFSKRTAEAGFDAKGVVAIRFWLFIALCLGISLVTAPASSLVLPARLYVPILILSMAGVILPSFVVQLGVARSEPITVALLFATTPAISYLIQLLDHRLVPSVLSLIGVLACVGFTAYGTWARLGKKAAPAPAPAPVVPSAR